MWQSRGPAYVDNARGSRWLRHQEDIKPSQGEQNRIERVHLDLGSGAFKTGQTYVALSRCRSVEGLSMNRPLTEADIRVDYESKAFYDQLRATVKNLPADVLMAKLTPEEAASTWSHRKVV